MRILVLAPHTDDGEFGCGGSIARFASEGNEVHYVAFSAAERFPEILGQRAGLNSAKDREAQ